MRARDISAVALFAAFITVLGFVPPIFLPFFPAVPLSLHSLGAMLAGAVLGAKRGFYAVALYWLLLAAGLAVAGGSSGMAALLGPMGGYIFGFGLAAFAIGCCYDKWHKPNKTQEFCFMVFGGIILLYAAGIIWLAVLTKMPLRQLLLLNTVFLPGDCAKIFAVIALRRSLAAIAPRAFR